MSKRTVIGLISVFIVLLIFGVTFFLVDFNLVVRGNVPKLSIKNNAYNEEADDGKVEVYMGLFYKIIRYNVGTEFLTNKFGTWFLTYDQGLVKNDVNSINVLDNGYDITGEIVSFDEKQLVLEVKSNLVTSKYEDAIVRINSDTIITKDSKELYKKDLKKGNIVKIKFTGIVTRSIPPQAIAARIVVEE